MPGSPTAEAAILEALAQRLEDALDLVAAADAISNLSKIAKLCADSEVLSLAATILTET